MILAIFAIVCLFNEFKTEKTFDFEVEKAKIRKKIEDDMMAKYDKAMESYENEIR